MWRLGNCGGFVYFCPFVYCVFVYYCQLCLLSISLLYIRCFCGSGEPCGRAVTKGERNNLRDVQSFSISMCIHSQYFLCNNSLSQCTIFLNLHMNQFSTFLCALFLDLHMHSLLFSPNIGVHSFSTFLNI